MYNNTIQNKTNSFDLLLQCNEWHKGVLETFFENIDHFSLSVLINISKNIVDKL